MNRISVSEIESTITKLNLNVGLAHEIRQIHYGKGTPDAINPNWLVASNKIILDHIVDCDSRPFVPDGWSIHEHQKGGIFKCVATNLATNLDLCQKNGNSISGDDLRKALVGKPVLNANVLDYLLAHPYLIPEEWKREVVSFWGTIYQDRQGGQIVRSLLWLGGGWVWTARCLGLNWYESNPAAVIAS